MTSQLGRVVVIGGGISGVTVAERLAVAADAAGARDDVRIELRDAGAELGGKLRTSPFAGRPAVDEGADAFLRRVPHGLALARRVGLGDDLTSPTSASAAVWHHGLHALPDGLLLGVPAGVMGLARSGLLGRRAKLRAAVEPLLPRRDHADSIGQLIRYRFGDAVHERLVDTLIGSIYAADTDRFSLTMVPQLADLASRRRSLLLAGRSARRSRPPAGEPIFATPSTGMQPLATMTAAAAEAHGAVVVRSSPVHEVVSDGDAWRVDGQPADAVVLATPSADTADLVAGVAPDLAAHLTNQAWADVAIVTLHVPSWPDRLRGRSGYLVPKPVQGRVTAVSFGSQKWAHWAEGGGEILRVSIGRDGAPIDDLDDDELVTTAVAEVGGHLDVDVQPTAARTTRWTRAFPQYRPGHLEWLVAVTDATPHGLHLTGASYRGIGVPACIADAERVAAEVWGELRAGVGVG